MYNRPRMRGRTKFLLVALDVVFLGFVIGLDNLIRLAALVILLAVIIGFGFWLGFEYGEEKGGTAERKRMLDEGYSLGYQEPPETDGDVKPLRTCKRCGHIITDD